MFVFNINYHNLCIIFRTNDISQHVKLYFNYLIFVNISVTHLTRHELAFGVELIKHLLFHLCKYVT